MCRRFKPSLWIRATEDHKKHGVQREHMPRSFKKFLPKVQELHSRNSPDSEATKKSHHSQDQMEQLFATEDAELIRETDVEEVWFAGCHCGKNLVFGKVQF